MASISQSVFKICVCLLALSSSGAWGTYLNLTQFPGEECNRVCTVGGQRTCYFQFTLEHYQAMGVACKACAQGVKEDCDLPQCIVGDGIEKGVMSINRMIPGPAIQVCQGDFVVIDVINNAAGTAAALHWHGLHMVETPWMDGVPFVTQCPVMFANTFRYQFYATEAGTQFYHSHSGHHKINGQYGALIVRQPVAQDQHSASYDYDLPEHHIVISDWMHDYGEQLFPGLPSVGGIFPNSVLINGRGQFITQTSDAGGNKIYTRTDVPPARFYVEPGKRYRFRVINSVSHACPFQLQVENHNLTIIASDSHNVIQANYDTLVTNSGERYDFVLTANKGSGDFWIRVRGMGVCAINPTESFALLRYKSNDPSELPDDERPLPTMPSFDEIYPDNKILNHPNATCFGDLHGDCVTQLHSLNPVDEQLRTAEPAHRFYLAFHNYPVSNEEVFQPGTYNHFSNLAGNLTIVGAINNLSLVFPDYPPLTQPGDIDESQFCEENSWPRHCEGKRLCPCIHRLRVNLNSIVELIVVDESENVGRMHHPFHLHGYHFMVTDLGRNENNVPMTIESVKLMESRNMLPRTGNILPPLKDTVSIPSRGYAKLRFRATNPGFWLMHCHYEWHLSIGMGLIVQVGRTTQMRNAPLRFPRCNNYVPRVLRPRF